MQNHEKYIVETIDLSFAFSKKKPVVKDLNLRIPTGAIYGFLGPNGAGKTTTIRLILNLLAPQTGSVHIFGHAMNGQVPGLFSRIGALIETPSLYEHLSGLDNLKITALLSGTPKDRIAEVLEIVKLSPHASTYVKNYSLGMKQRLGLALALLSNPELLILDEPTNGLDPRGMIEIRELLLHLNRDHGISILISSHLLAEIEKLATHIGIIHEGKMLFQGPASGLPGKGDLEDKFLSLIEN